MAWFISRVRRKLRVFGNPEPLLDRWHSALKRGENVVVIDAALDARLLSHLSKYPDQVTLFFWNKLSTVRFFCPCIDDYLGKFKIYSHDHNDCQQQGFEYNSTFYSPKTYKTPPQVTTDISFIGANKKRLDVITEIYQKLGGLSRDFYVRDYANAGQEPAPGLVLQREFLNYSNYLDRMMTSRAILDVLQPGQNSMTLRVMESLFHQKKLITSYTRLASEDFYHPNNILLFNDASELTHELISEFLDKPYQPIDPAICERFSYESWIKRFA